MTYFFSDFLLYNKYLMQRKNRLSIAGFFLAKVISSGDVLNISYKHKGYAYYFEGICIAIKNKLSVQPDTSYTIRNVIANVGVEFTVSFFYNRVFFSRISDFKRKRFHYFTTKLFFLRRLSDTYSTIKH